MPTCYLHPILLVMLPLMVTATAPFDENTCMDEIAKHNTIAMTNPKHQPITEDFPKIVVHGVHSMTLANLRYYFNKNAPSDNGIPVINFNLSSILPAVLGSTPDIPLHNNFPHPAMDALDQTLSHMTDNDWDIRNAPPLERVVHAIHMLEVWEMAKPFYKQLKKKTNKRIKNKLCPCLTAVEDNGIMDMMKDLAKKMRDTRVIWRYGACTCCYGGGKGGGIFGGGGSGGGGGKKPYLQFAKQKYWKPNPCDQQQRSLGQVDPSTSQPTTNLTNEGEWEIWKNNMDMSQDSESHGYQLALYLFCALN